MLITYGFLLTASACWSRVLIQVVDVAHLGHTVVRAHNLLRVRRGALQSPGGTGPNKSLTPACFGLLRFGSYKNDSFKFLMA